MENKEIECRFLEIDKEALIKKLRDLGAEDKGEVKLKELITYGPNIDWKKQHKHIRIRQSGDKVMITYKHHLELTVDGTEEIELVVDSFEKAEKFLDRAGLLVKARRQEKFRHTFILDGVTVDIDTWPKVPTYVEFEGESENALKEASAKCGFDWKDASFINPSTIVTEKYGIPVRDLSYFMFDRIE